MSEVVSIHAARSASAAATRSASSAPTSGDGTSFKAALSDASEASTKRPKGEKTEKVAGRHYEKITAGPDKGHYLNRTGNARDGEDFRIVQRGGRVFHVYDTNHDHQVFELPHDPKSVTVKASETGGTTPAA